MLFMLLCFDQKWVQVPILISMLGCETAPCTIKPFFLFRTPILTLKTDYSIYDSDRLCHSSDEEAGDCYCMLV
jgi:hypothetical protein